MNLSLIWQTHDHSPSTSIILKLTVSPLVPSPSHVKIITLLPGRQKPCSYATFKIILTSWS